MAKLREDTIEVYAEQLLDSLGFLSSRYLFRDIVPEETVREEIKRFDTDAAKILLGSPTYFVMPKELKGSTEERVKKAKQQILFIKLVSTNELPIDEFYVYEKYYGENHILFICTELNKKIILMSKLSDIKTTIRDKKAILKFPDIEPAEVFSKMGLDLTLQEIRQQIDNYKKSIFG